MIFLKFLNFVLGSLAVQKNHPVGLLSSGYDHDQYDLYSSEYELRGQLVI